MHKCPGGFGFSQRGNVVLVGSGGSVVVEAGILTVVVGATRVLAPEAWLLPQLAKVSTIGRSIKVF